MYTSCIVLAAGYSSRMGTLKALLPFGEDSVIIKQIKMLQRAGIDEIIPVLGYRETDIREELRGYDVDVNIAVNPLYDHGMFSSVQAGAAHLNNRCERFFILPVDCPLISEKVFIRLLEEYKASSDEKKEEKIYIPSFEGKSGHPPFFPYSFSKKILESGDVSLKELIDIKGNKEYVEMEYEEILFDMDTMEDYRRLLNTATARMPDEVH